MNIEGRVWKFGDNVDTDLIIPARFLNISDKELLAQNCFVDIRPDFAKDVAANDILIAGSNFGCGSSREHAPWAIKTAGIGVIIAKSFARIFYRNAFNIGLPILESEEAFDAFSEGERLSVDISSGKIMSMETDKSLMARPIPEFMRKIIQSGGLMNQVKKTMVKK
jgi:3-isopropylmalate/(R)-2-methylmalate dehydratase small subunit